MKKMTGRGPKNRDVDSALYAWYSVRRSSGERPKSSAVQARAREMYEAAGYLDMKCSYGWFKRWSQRFRIQLRFVTSKKVLLSKTQQQRKVLLALPVAKNAIVSQGT
jgi:hypothetical protein